MTTIPRLLTVCVPIVWGGCALAAPPDPRAVFAPLVLPVPPSQTRAAAGVPGPGYWQNRADYRIDARIDTAKHVLSGTEMITYTNNSPDTLDVLWLQLDQNSYRRDARAAVAPNREPRTAEQYTDGDVLDSVAIEQAGHTTTPGTIVSDTRLQVRPATAIPPHGVVKLHIAWHYAITGEWGGRTAVSDATGGEIYAIAQWYPRMAVYDDLRGWDTAPYLGSEFYLEYGDFDYAVTVPWNFLVVGSGALSNPQDVLTATERARLAQAAGSDATVMIRAPGEVGDAATRPTHSGTQTWRFHMGNTRDVSFAASAAFVWDAARINLPAGKHALAMSVYPADSAGSAKWGRSTEYVKFSIEYFSKTWFPYPWPVMVNLGAHPAGMEYPGIVFDDKKDAGKNLFWITAHETGHSWFPMIVGSNERRDAWMDEGFNTFIDVGASDAFNHGEYAPKRDSEYAPGGGNPVDGILPLLADAEAPTIVTAPDLVAEKYRHAVHYYKPALGLVLLRAQILGPDRFDPAFRRYIAAWAYKHPSPSDFFRFMNSDAGEDLSWWWRGWYFTNGPIDLALTHAAADGTNGTRVDIASRGAMPMPTTIEATYADGSHTRVRLPVEAFLQGMTATITIPTTRPATRVTIDPDHAIPDADRGNNFVAVR